MSTSRTATITIGAGHADGPDGGSVPVTVTLGPAPYDGGCSDQVGAQVMLGLGIGQSSRATLSISGPDQRCRDGGFIDNRTTPALPAFCTATRADGTTRRVPVTFGGGLIDGSCTPPSVPGVVVDPTAQTCTFHLDAMPVAIHGGGARVGDALDCTARVTVAGLAPP